MTIVLNKALERAKEHYSIVGWEPCAYPFEPANWQQNPTYVLSIGPEGPVLYKEGIVVASWAKHIFEKEE